MTAAQPAAQYGPIDLAQRNAILDQEIRKFPQTVSNYKRTFPIKVKVDRDTASAVVTYGASPASLLIIVAMAVLATITWGLTLPWWLYLLLRPKYNKNVSIDEAGAAHCTPRITVVEYAVAAGVGIALIRMIIWYLNFIQSLGH